MSDSKLIKDMSPKQTAEQSWTQKIDIVEKWLLKRGYRLIQGNQKYIVDSVNFELKIVLLSKRSKVENQFYSILHECGHILNRGKGFEQKYNILVESEEDVRKQKNIRYLTQEIEEEAEAWRRGETLATKLKLNVDSNKYHSYASRYLMTYILAAAKGKQYLASKEQNKTPEKK
jgi:hypothetical protein